VRTSRGSYALLGQAEEAVKPRRTWIGANSRTLIRARKRLKGGRPCAERWRRIQGRRSNGPGWSSREIGFFKMDGLVEMTREKYALHLWPESFIRNTGRTCSEGGSPARGWASEKTEGKARRSESDGYPGTRGP